MVLTFIVSLTASSSNPTTLSALKAALVDASNVYSKDAGTLSWHVMQDRSDPRVFSIVERFEDEAGFQRHRANPYKQDVWDKTVPGLLERPYEVKRFEELEGQNVEDGGMLHGSEMR